jgi:hypothetical protein
VENGDAQSQHTCTLSKNTLITASTRWVRGAGKSRRALSPMVSRGVERSIKRRVERVEHRSVHQRAGEQVGEVVEGRGQVSEEKKSSLCAHDTHNACVQPHTSLAGKRWARRGGMPMVPDTQGKWWKRPKVSRIPAHPAHVLWQGALLTGVCWRDVRLCGQKTRHLTVGKKPDTCGQKTNDT